jgi:hypothetical protein
MADSLPLLTGTAADIPVEGSLALSLEGPSVASMASDGLPRDLFSDFESGNSHLGGTPATQASVIEPSTAIVVDVLMQELPQHVPEGPHNKDTPASDMTGSLGTALSPESLKSPEMRKIPNFDRLGAKFDAGYDSDGEPPPKTVTVDFDEPAIEERTAEGTRIVQEGSRIAVGSVENVHIAVNREPRHIAIDEASLKKMTVANLRQELRIREVHFIPTLKKPDLLKRLQQALARKVKVSIFGPIHTDKGTTGKKKAGLNDMAGFAPGAYWEQLKPKDVPVEEPLNTIRNARAPTVPENEAGSVPVKHDFAETFDRPIFSGKKQVQKTHRNNRKMFDGDGNPLMESVQRQLIMPRQDFLQKHKLTAYSDAVEFANAFFLTWKENPYHPNLLSMHTLTAYTNMKASLANAGPGGNCYPDWVDFTVDELRQHIGLYVWNGLNPSPRLEMKLQPQHLDPMHGNDYLYQHMGPKATRRHKHFRAFFACQDPR